MSILSRSACWGGCPAAQLHLQTHTRVIALPASQKQALCTLWTSTVVLTCIKPGALELLGQGSPDQVGDVSPGHLVICCSCRTLGPIKVQHCKLGAEYTYVMADGAGSGIHAGLAALLQLQAECMQTGSVILHAGRHTLLADSCCPLCSYPCCFEPEGGTCGTAFRMCANAEISCGFSA